jgi:putative DNA methylase
MASKKELLAQEVARAVGAGKAVALETVDFSDPNRPKTCLEVDFPLVSINEIASLEAASGASKNQYIRCLSGGHAASLACSVRC